MRDFLMVVEIIISILLIVVVVAQTGKSAGMGGAVSGAADSVFGGKERGVDGFLSRCTVVLATLFILVSLALDLEFLLIHKKPYPMVGFFYRYIEVL